MAGELRNFDPEKVTVSFTFPGGSIDLTQGLIDGPGAISFTKDAPRWTRRSDRQGNAARIKSGKLGGFLTLTYVHEAPIHNELSALLLADMAAENIVGIIKVKDLNGSTTHELLGCFIENDPDFAYGDTAGDRVWIFGCAQLVPKHGGNEVA